VTKKESAAESIAARLGTFFRKSGQPGWVSAYLFGSVAENRAHAESDIDVGVLLRRDKYPTATDRFRARVELSASLARELKHDPVDVVILNDAPPLLGRRIVTTGTRVFCADQEEDHAFVRDVQLRAADLEPFLRRTARLKLNAILR